MGCKASPIPKEIRMRAYRKAYKLRHPERIVASKERWRKNNLEKSRAYSLKTRSKYLEETKERERQYSKNNPHIVARKNALRRAKYYDVRREKYNRIDIFNRDKGICCICKEFINLALPPRHLFSFTIQHHIPLSKGGADAPDNLGIAHYSCNSRIGNRTMTA